MKKRTKIWIYSLSIIGILLILINSCKKNDDSPPPPTPETVTDIDGNVYHTVTIGTQVWMVENLKTTKYNDGVSVPPVTDNTAWGSTSTSGFCWYNNDATYKNYGAFYNWFAVFTGKLAPVGWHVPTDAEASILIDFLGGESVAGGKLKETGTTHWQSPNTGATNSSGFTAVASGCRYYNGSFVGFSQSSGFWTSSKYNEANAWYRGFAFDNTIVSRSNGPRNYGFIVRCLKDVAE